MKYILEKGTILYHGTIHDFEMKEITMPCWFSKYKDQAINHVCYKHFGKPNGFLLSYRLNKDTTVYDISNNGDIRMEINAYGNYRVANRFYYKEYGDEFDGYINLPEQGEIMLVSRNCIDPLQKLNIDLDRKVKYCNIDGKNWRMTKKKKKKYCIIQ